MEKGAAGAGTEACLCCVMMQFLDLYTERWRGVILFHAMLQAGYNFLG